MSWQDFALHHALADKHPVGLSVRALLIVLPNIAETGPAWAKFGRLTALGHIFYLCCPIPLDVRRCLANFKPRPMLINTSPIRQTSGDIYRIGPDLGPMLADLSDFGQLRSILVKLRPDLDELSHTLVNMWPTWGQN